MKNQIAQLLYQEYGDSPETDLNSINQFTLLCAVVLSARTRDSQVNIVTAELFQLIRTPIDMIKISYQKLESIINKIGLYKTKAKNLQKLSHQLIDLGYPDGQIPNNLNMLLSLAGVGIKTAYVLLNILFDHDYIAVDTHVFRVSQRIGLVYSSVLLDVVKEINTLVIDYKKNLHTFLIQHGRKICKPMPQCNKCILNRLCQKRNI